MCLTGELSGFLSKERGAKSFFPNMSQNGQIRVNGLIRKLRKILSLCVTAHNHGLSVSEIRAIKDFLFMLCANIEINPALCLAFWLVMSILRRNMRDPLRLAKVLLGDLGTEVLVILCSQVNV